MNNGLENLEGVVSKLKEQGINAGEAEKQRIIEAAKKQAEEIVAKAEQEKNEIIKKKEAQVKLLEENSKAALQQASRDFIEATKIAIIKHLENCFGEQSQKLITQEEYLTELLKVMLETISGTTAVSVSPELVQKMEAYLIKTAFKDKVVVKPLAQSEAKIVIDGSDKDKVQFVLNAKDIQEGLFTLLNQDLIDKITKQEEA